MSCGVGCRNSSDPMLLWLWHRPAAEAPIRPQALEPTYATEAALEKAKKQKKKKNYPIKCPLYQYLEVFEYYFF